MHNWRKKLDVFLENFEHAADIIGILVCGSYITGNPTNHSDLDVHLILNNNVNYRQRGNKIIDGLLIEYFANPPKQIHQYFNEDLQGKDLMSQTQFATGQIIQDKTGEVEALKKKAKQMIAAFYDSPPNFTLSELDKYFLWDMLDDLQDAHETNRPDFDFLYHTRLNALLGKYLHAQNRPYNAKTILGNITDPATREKYLLRELPDETIAALIATAITANTQVNKIDAYKKLTTEILRQLGGFDIDGFKLKSGLEIF